MITEAMMDFAAAFVLRQPPDVRKRLDHSARSIAQANGYAWDELPLRTPLPGVSRLYITVLAIGVINSMLTETKALPR